MSYIRQSFHGVTGAKLSRKGPLDRDTPLASGVHTTDLDVFDVDGNWITITLFSDGPLKFEHNNELPPPPPPRSR